MNKIRVILTAVFLLSVNFQPLFCNAGQKPAMLMPAGLNELSVLKSVNPFFNEQYKLTLREERIARIFLKDLLAFEKIIHQFNCQTLSEIKTDSFRHLVSVILEEPNKYYAVVDAAENLYGELYSSRYTPTIDSIFETLMFILRLAKTLKEERILVENRIIKQLGHYESPKYWMSKRIGMNRADADKAAKFLNHLIGKANDGINKAKILIATPEDFSDVCVSFLNDTQQIVLNELIKKQDSADYALRWAFKQIENSKHSFDSWSKMQEYIIIALNNGPFKSVSIDAVNLLSDMERKISVYMEDDIRRLNRLGAGIEFELTGLAFTESFLRSRPMLELEALKAWLEGDEWRNVFVWSDQKIADGYKNYYNFRFERPAEDLLFFVERHLAGIFKIPKSDRISEWRASIKRLEPKKIIIPVDLDSNNERLFQMINMYRNLYGRIYGQNPDHTHNQVLIEMGEFLRKLDTAGPKRGINISQAGLFKSQ